MLRKRIPTQTPDIASQYAVGLVTRSHGGADCAPYPLLRAVLLYHVYFVHVATASESAARGELCKERSLNSRVKLYCSSHGRIPLKRYAVGVEPMEVHQKNPSQKTWIFLSKPQAWYIIAAQSAVYIIKGGLPPLHLITL